MHMKQGKSVHGQFQNLQGCNGLNHYPRLVTFALHAHSPYLWHRTPPCWGLRPQTPASHYCLLSFLFYILHLPLSLLLPLFLLPLISVIFIDHSHFMLTHYTYSISSTLCPQTPLFHYYIWYFLFYLLPFSLLLTFFLSTLLSLFTICITCFYITFLYYLYIYQPYLYYTYPYYTYLYYLF